MSLQNKWIRYIDRTYLQIKQRVLTDMQVLVPEITDHTESNPYVNMLSIWAGIAEMLGYYIDSAARGAHLSTARLYWSGVKIANAYDYRIHSYLPSTAQVTFRLNGITPSDILIPLGTEVQNDDGVLYYTIADAIIEAGTSEIVTTVKQFTTAQEIEIGISNGNPLQSFIIDDDVVDGSVILKVDGVGWQSKPTLGYSLPTDEHFVQTVNINKQPIVRFGDGVNGAIPASGSVITVEYQRTEGARGNTGAYTITTLNSTIALPTGLELEVFNVERNSGGSDVESLEQLKRRIPKSIRTLMRAVTKQDFIDVAELKAGVAKAGVDFECGKPVNVYIVPDGGGIASQSLLDDTQQWLDERRLITVGVNVQRAGEIRILLQISLRVLPQYTRTLVVNNVRQNLVDFLSYRYQEIGGEVQLSDIYEIIENTDGVKNSTVEVMRPRPYARPINNDVALNWTCTIQNGSVDTLRWQIKMISETTFELFKGSSLIGTFSVGTYLSFPEIALQVDAGLYEVGYIWEFFTYPFYGTINITEPSLPVSLEEDIVITASGGL